MMEHKTDWKLDDTVMPGDMNRIESNNAENADAMLKKDGSVQMTGVLKTVGGVGEQINFGDSCIYVDNNGKSTFTIMCNAYRDGDLSRYKQDGKAYAIEFGTTYADKIAFYTAVSGVKDAQITWVSSDILTDKTGLPLTGGTLTDNITIAKNLDPGIFLANPTGRAMALQYTTVANLRNGLDNNNYARIYVGSETGELSTMFQLEVRNSGTGTHYPIYGAHNITVSTSAPGSTLANGAQHQVY